MVTFWPIVAGAVVAATVGLAAAAAAVGAVVGTPVGAAAAAVVGFGAAAGAAVGAAVGAAAGAALWQAWSNAVVVVAVASKARARKVRRRVVVVASSDVDIGGVGKPPSELGRPQQSWGWAPSPQTDSPWIMHNAESCTSLSSGDPLPSSRTLQPADRRTMVVHAYDQLLTAITNGTFPPGRRLVIDDLASDLGVSITPVREALRQLQRDGLVTEVPYAGMQVAAPSITEIKELYTVLGVLEGFAVRRAAESLTPIELETISRELDTLRAAAEAVDVPTFLRHNLHFHRQIVAVGAGAGPLLDLIEQLRRNVARFAAMAQALDDEYLQASQVEHEQLYDCVRLGQADAAEALARRHALTFAAHLARCLEEQSTAHRSA
jgi:DNA-binding GntR family transcriptional regulator